ncbi:aspartate carbamoyltransferase catalytic subunit [Prochlorococcus sp. MIT 1300]|uniref:aspartate carbamoyltransferase catalytic subunit n=1 Tax=Prochlorococcus sp. MIT 1300 TaxID=3096218 RepID=UPI002A763398|nr:aspartate carbamoyltransferase catalytic subunit [Prochlorococcus sp. MIT 1300]
MSNWNHRHILDLAAFSIADFDSVIELAHRFRSIPKTGARRLPALQGRLVATLFFEPSTRTRSSFELAAKSLSADVQSFTPATSSLSKGETPVDTALTYVAMGADVLVIRHNSSSIPQRIANALDQTNSNTRVLNGGDGLHSHPSQGLLDLYTLASHFNPQKPSSKELNGKKIVIVGDILHSRVARSNIWSLTACGADVILCGPPSLLPDTFKAFVDEPPPGQKKDPVKKRGDIKILYSLEEALPEADAVMALRLQKERMSQNLLTDLDQYHLDYGLTHHQLKLCGRHVPVLHPGPVNRGIELSGDLLDDKSICLVDKQVQNGIPIRMALLYLMTKMKSALD